MGETRIKMQKTKKSNAPKYGNIGLSNFYFLAKVLLLLYATIIQRIVSKKIQHTMQAPAVNK